MAEQVEQQIETIFNHPYKITNELCTSLERQFPAYTYQDQNNPTPRMSYIMDKLREMGKDFKTDWFDSGMLGVDLCNIIVSFGNDHSDESVMFVAHHDILNPNSENANDNSASVAHLLSLINYLQYNEPHTNVYIVFTDAEENGHKGAHYLSRRILNGDYDDVRSIFNLELTGVGDQLYIEQAGVNGATRKIKELINDGAEYETSYELKTPISDTTAFRFEGIKNSVCIGTLPHKDVMDLLQNKMCNVWKRCHTQHDLFDYMVEDDMNKFQQFLRTLATWKYVVTEI